MAERVLLDHIVEHWAERLGCEPRLLRAPGVLVLRHGAQLASYHGAYLFRWQDVCVVSVPEQDAGRLAVALAGRSPDDLFDKSAVAALFGGEVERIIGPATQACIYERSFRPTDERGTRALTADGAEALLQLAAACDPTEWEHSGIESEGAVVFGCFADEQLAAAGMVKADGALRQIGIVTHPAFRGKGYGRAVVSAMTRSALDEGAIPHYQTLASNTASRAVARSLGFAEYAQTLAVRLMPGG